MKELIPVLAGFLAALLFACGPKTDQQRDISFVDSEATTWLARTGENSFMVIQDNAGQIRVKELPSGTVHPMGHVQTASGAKYQDAEGYFFWTKGDDFMWGKGEETLASGKKQRTEQFMPPSIESHLFGSYVSDGYAKRVEGYDWVGVRIEKLASGRISVSVRSRGDRKRPTCTFDGNAIVVDQKTLKVVDNQASMILSFVKDSLYIKPETEADRDRLFYYCSGGASLAGEFVKIEGDLSSTVDKTKYIRSLFYNDQTGFWLEQQDSVLKIRPFGLSGDNRELTQVINGEIMGSEVSDINGDNSPELSIYIDAGQPDHRGSAIVYSVNNGKSVSMVNVPGLTADQSRGYQGFDEFTFVENAFIRRFPLFRAADGRSTRTGYTRQIQYKLQEGEAMRQLVVEKVVEY